MKIIQWCDECHLFFLEGKINLSCYMDGAPIRLDLRVGEEHQFHYLIDY